MLNPKVKHKHPTVWDPNRTFWATDVAGNVPCEPTDAHALLSVATTTDAASTGTTIWRAGAHAEENCAAAEEAWLPSASTASATWLRRIREYAAALRSRLRLGHPVVEHVSDSVAWSRRSRKTRAGAVRCRRRQSSRLLRWARKGAGYELTWRRGGKVRYVSVRWAPGWFGARGQGWAFGGWLNVLRGLG